MPSKVQLKSPEGSSVGSSGGEESQGQGQGQDQGADGKPARRVIVLILEWCAGGNLLQMIQKQEHGVLSEAKTINLVLLPLLKALCYLHSQVREG